MLKKGINYIAQIILTVKKSVYTGSQLAKVLDNKNFENHLKFIFMKRFIPRTRLNKHDILRQLNLN